MANPLRECAGTPAIFFLLVGLAGCTQVTAVSQPALDTEPLRQVDALVVTTEVTGGFSAPRRFVKNPEEGGKAGMKAYLDAAPSNEGALGWLVLMPVALPLAGIIGSAMAPTAEESEAAISAFDRIGRNRMLPASLDRRLAERLGAATGVQWRCLAVGAPGEVDLCPGAVSVATVTLSPRFALQTKGNFDPEIHILASVTATANGPGLAAPVEAEWRYRGEAGTLLELAADDGALLRRRLEAILDAFAVAIAEDLFVDPQPEDVAFRHSPWRPPDSGTIVENKGVVRRVPVGRPVALRIELTNKALIAGLDPPGYAHRRCRILSVDGRAEPAACRQRGQSADFQPPTIVLVAPGTHRLEIICPTYYEKQPPAQRTIMVETGPATISFTDGVTVTQRPAHAGFSLPPDLCGQELRVP